MSALTKGNIKASKLSPGQVVEMRRLYATGRYTQGDLCRMFGLSVVQVGRIVRGEVWQQLPKESGPVSPGEIQASAERMWELQESLRGQQRLQEEAGKSAEGMLKELGNAPPPSPLDEE